MSLKPVEVSPRTLARIGGALYLVIILIGILGEGVIRESIVVSGDAVKTAANMGAHESLWRFGAAAELVLLTCGITLSAIFYVLMRVVSRTLALVATFFNLVSLAVEAVAALSLVAALFPLGSAAYLAAFEPEQLAAMASLTIKSHTFGFGVALIFFGWFCAVIGYLIFKSGFMPKVIGVLMQLAGVCYLVNSFTMILAPSVADRLFPAILLPPFIGESALCLSMLVKGVNVERWNEWQARKQVGARID